jgi:hypothetical protein
MMPCGPGGKIHDRQHLNLTGNLLYVRNFVPNFYEGLFSTLSVCISRIFRVTSPSMQHLNSILYSGFRLLVRFIITAWVIMGDSTPHIDDEPHTVLRLEIGDLPGNDAVKSFVVFLSGSTKAMRLRPRTMPSLQRPASLIVLQAATTVPLEPRTCRCGPLVVQ